MKKCSICFYLLLALPITCFGGVFTEVEYLYGDGFQNKGNPDSIERSIISIHHSAQYGVFKQYGFIDFFLQNGHQGQGVKEDPDAAGFYGEYYPSLSLTQLAGLNLESFFIKSINLTAGINYGRHDGHNYPVTQVALYGISFDINVPVGFLNISLLAYDDYSYSASGDADSYITYQFTPAWKFPFEVLGQRFEFAGYADFVGSKGPGKVPYIGTQLQFRYDVGHLFGHDNKAFVGMEYHIFKNKFGIKGLDEYVPQAMVVWVF